jgi:hypothetical protein
MTPQQQETVSGAAIGAAAGAGDLAIAKQIRHALAQLHPLGALLAIAQDLLAHAELAGVVDHRLNRHHPSRLVLRLKARCLIA